MNSSTASAEVKRESTLAFFFGWEISDWIAKEGATMCAALELAAEEVGAWLTVSHLLIRNWRIPMCVCTKHPSSSTNGMVNTVAMVKVYQYGGLERDFK